MKMKISELKILARRSLAGQYGLAILVVVFIMALTIAGSLLADLLFQSQSMASEIMSNVFAFVLSLVFSVFTIGMNYIFLNLSRGREAKFNQITYMFNHQPDRAIVVAMVLSVLQYICMAPEMIYGYKLDIATATMDEIMTLSALTTAGMLAYLVVSLPFTFATYLLADREDMGPAAALRESLRLMKGNYGRMLYLVFSFIPLSVLGIVSLGIGFLWILPYMTMTEVKFYQEAIGEIKRKQHHIVMPTMPPVNPGIDDLDTGTGDDDGYNAEA